LISRIVKRIVVDNSELYIFLSHAELYKDLLGEIPSADSSAEIQLHEPISVARRGSAVKLILSNGECKSDVPIASLVRAVAQAKMWSEWIVAGKVRNLPQKRASTNAMRREFFDWRHCLQRSTKRSSLVITHPCSPCPFLRKIFP
jgi:hypothetical protein